MMKEKIRSLVHSILDCIHYLVGSFITVNNNKVFFESYPDFSDNCRALSDYLLAHSKYDIYWAVNKIPTFKVDERIHFLLKADKWKYIYHTLSSKYLFSTHSAFAWSSPKRQIYTCLWHGSPLKKICRLQDPVKNKYYLNNVNFFIAPSSTYEEVYFQTFGAKWRQILHCGYPRCDQLFNQNDYLKKLCINRSDFKKIIIYLPTFRQVANSSVSDSSQDTFSDSIMDFTNYDNILGWNNYFNSIGILLIVKPHPADKMQLESMHFSNIIIMQNAKMAKDDIQLYGLLHHADALLTDYSSVFCDFMVLNRPIGFITDDFEEYNKNRGFIFDNPLEYLPGVQINKKTDFKQFCTDVVDGNDKSSDLRSGKMSIFNEYVTCDFCSCVCKELKLNINN